MFITVESTLKGKKDIINLDKVKRISNTAEGKAVFFYDDGNEYVSNSMINAVEGSISVRERELAREMKPVIDK